MKRFRISMLALLTLLVASGVTLIIKAALADGLEVIKEQGHLAPVKIEVTYNSGAKKTGLLLHSENSSANKSQVAVSRNKKGGGEILVYHDTLTAIKEITGETGLYVFKNGTEERIDLSPNFWVVTENDAREKLDWTKVKSVKYIAPARKDDEGNAMFDHWKYSPYTGKKIDKEE